MEGANAPGLELLLRETGGTWPSTNAELQTFSTFVTREPRILSKSRTLSTLPLISVMARSCL